MLLSDPVSGSGSPDRIWRKLYSIVGKSNWCLHETLCSPLAFVQALALQKLAVSINQCASFSILPSFQVYKINKLNHKHLTTVLPGIEAVASCSLSSSTWLEDWKKSVWLWFLLLDVLSSVQALWNQTQLCFMRFIWSLLDVKQGNRSEREETKAASPSSGSLQVSAPGRAACQPAFHKE